VMLSLSQALPIRHGCHKAQYGIPVDGRALKVIRNAREVSEDIAVLIDTKGPEIRTNRSGMLST